MAKHTFWSRLKRVFLKTHRHRTQGFTLLELLVVTAIAGGIVAGLTFIVVQIMTADQREASRSETQREMQMALDYISAELREAIYVYPGEYLACSGNPGGSCKPFSDFLPNAVKTNSVPVLAFWKLQPFPAKIKNDCAAAEQKDVACLAGQSYALVVYSLTKNEPGDARWKGKARITRYVLSQFDSNGNPNTGYVDPGLNRNLTSWPYKGDTNLQAGTPTGTADTLVDFVAFDFADATLSADLKQAGFCPNLPDPTGTTTPIDEYSISPPDSLLKGEFAGIRTFYACVAAPLTEVETGAGAGTRIADQSAYRDTILYLTGNASGRPGIAPDRNGLNLRGRNQDILPTLQTRILSRSVLGRRPNDE
ncbi:MAG: prepilin-type N-terminal cleavage/methylation domain-containing protein [Cyanobacteria bacterium RM1_2_2]|nr:prepilin-type N-terminal cleavage/methylation domain-containing protein [Cyanobacteria bacterium RM1_2_2]